MLGDDGLDCGNELRIMALQGVLCAPDGLAVLELGDEVALELAHVSRISTFQTAAMSLRLRRKTRSR